MPSSKRKLELGVFLIAWLPYAVLVKCFWFISDDAFISFRYSRNWALGHGLRYNLGEHVPVEGYSNFLWVIWCGIFEYLKLDVTLWAVFTSFVSGSVVLYLVFRCLHQRFHLNLFLATVVTLSLGSFAPFFVWSSGGLATIPFVLALFATFERLILRKEGSSPVVAGFLGLLVVLLRVEGIAWSILVGIAACISCWLRTKPIERPLLWYFLIVAGGFCVFLVWRYTYYGSLVSNTVHAKVGMSVPILLFGVHYLVHYILTFIHLILLIPAIVIASLKPWRPVGIPVACLSLSVFGYSVAVGGDWMPMGRLFTPGLPFNALLFGLLLQYLWERFPSRRAVAAFTFAVGLMCTSILPALNFHFVPVSVRSVFNFRRGWGNYWSEFDMWNGERRSSHDMRNKALALKEFSQPGDTIIAGGIGNLGYYSDLFIYDSYGLVDREVASRPFVKLLVPGHHKGVPIEHFLKYRPRFLIAHIVTSGNRFFKMIETFKSESRRLEKEFGYHSVVDFYVPTRGVLTPVTQQSRVALLENLMMPFRRSPKSTEVDKILVVWRKAPKRGPGGAHLRAVKSA
jgi:hypothetical protein